METQGVTATDLRAHFKDLANEIADGGAPAVISRHGYKMVALISYEDFELLQQIKRERQANEVKQGEKIFLPSRFPEHLPIEEVERLYKITEGSTDPETVAWRFRAHAILRGIKSPLAADPYSWRAPDKADPPS